VKSLLYAGGIVVVWMLAWGSMSIANALSGIAVAVGIRWLNDAPRPARAEQRFRPFPALKFAGFVLVRVAQSNVALARQVFMPASRLRPGVLAVPLPPMSDGLLTLVVNVLALSPGTIPLSTSEGADVLYVHFLHISDVESSRHDVTELVDLANRAFGEAAT
jgi:multicomponent Na+:H+ antiporter subunit E